MKGIVKRAVKWVALGAAIALIAAAIMHGNPAFGWQAVACFAIAGGEEITELVKGVLP